MEEERAESHERTKQSETKNSQPQSHDFLPVLRVPARLDPWRTLPSLTNGQNGTEKFIKSKKIEFLFCFLMIYGSPSVVGVWNFDGA